MTLPMSKSVMPRQMDETKNNMNIIEESLDKELNNLLFSSTSNNNKQIAMLQDAYYSAKLRSFELMNVRVALPLRLRSQQASRIYSTIATLLLSHLTIAKAKDFENYIKQKGSQLPLSLLDLKDWENVINVASNYRESESIPHKGITDMKNSTDLRLWIASQSIKKAKRDLKEVKAEFTKNVMNMRQEVQSFLSQIPPAIASYQLTITKEVEEVRCKNIELTNKAAVHHQILTDRDTVIEIMKDKLNKANIEISTLTQTNTQLLEENGNLKEDLEKYKKKSSQLEVYFEKISSIVKTLDNFHLKTLESMSESLNLSRYQALLSSFNDTDNNNSSSNSNYNSLSDLEAEKYVPRIQDIIQRCAIVETAYQHHMDTLLEPKNNLISDLNYTISELENKLKVCNTQLQENNNLKTDFEASQEKIRVLEENLSQSTVMSQNLSNKLSMEVKANDQLSIELKESKECMEDSECYIKELMNTLAKKSTDYDILSMEVMGYKEYKVESEQVIEELNGKIEEMNSKIEELNHQLQTSVAYQASIEKTVEDSMVSIKESRNTIQLLEEKIQTMTKVNTEEVPCVIVPTITTDNDIQFLQQQIVLLESKLSEVLVENDRLLSSLPLENRTLYTGTDNSSIDNSSYGYSAETPSIIDGKDSDRIIAEKLTNEIEELKKKSNAFLNELELEKERNRLLVENIKGIREKLKLLSPKTTQRINLFHSESPLANTKPSSQQPITLEADNILETIASFKNHSNVIKNVYDNYSNITGPRKDSIPAIISPTMSNVVDVDVMNTIGNHGDDCKSTDGNNNHSSNHNDNNNNTSINSNLLEFSELSDENMIMSTILPNVAATAEEEMENSIDEKTVSSNHMTQSIQAVSKDNIAQNSKILNSITASSANTNVNTNTNPDMDNTDISLYSYKGDDKVIMIQAMVRGFLERGRVRDMLLQKAAKEKGLLVAYEGTKQGDAGWYIEDDSLYYFCLDKGQFTLLCGPISEHIFSLALERVQERYTDTLLMTSLTSMCNKDIAIDRVVLQAISIQIESLQDQIRDRDHHIKTLNDELETYKISIDSDIEQIRKEFTEHINYLQIQLNQYEQSSSIQTIDEGNIKEQMNGQNNDSILSDPIGSGSIVTANTYADSGVNTTPGIFKGNDSNNNPNKINGESPFFNDSSLPTTTELDSTTLNNLTKVQAMARGFLTRTKIQSTKVLMSAQESGVLVAFKNTIQGESGWYTSPNGIFYFVQDNGEWVLAAGPISPRTYDRTRSFVKSKRIPSFQTLPREGSMMKFPSGFGFGALNDTHTLIQCPFKLVIEHEDVKGDIYMSSKTEKLFIAVSVDDLILSSQIQSIGNGSVTESDGSNTMQTDDQ